MAAGDPLIEHLLRRAGFGASSAELALYSGLSYSQAVDRLVNYDVLPDAVDANLGQPGVLGTTSRGVFLPIRFPTTRGSDGCSGWCIPPARCRKR